MDTKQIKGTESANPRSSGLDRMSTEAIIRLMNEEDAAVLTAVNACIPEIAGLADQYAETIRQGGRVFYLGAGTSGGLAQLDAAEVPPTFGIDPDRVIALSADPDMNYATDAEDCGNQCAALMARHGLRETDLVIGIAASGSTPFVLEGLKFAQRAGAATAAVVCNEQTPMKKIADLTIEVLTGPEVLTGSTRLKAGTAQKMVLNMISTAAMVKLGRTISNYMANVKPVNAKLRRRAVGIVMDVTGCNENTAVQALHDADDSCAEAVRLITDNRRYYRDERRS